MMKENKRLFELSCIFLTEMAIYFSYLEKATAMQQLFHFLVCALSIIAIETCICFDLLLY